MKKILLDTNAYALYLHGDENVLNAIVRADVVYMSVFVLGELYAAFRGGSKELKNKDMLERFLQKPTVEILPATSETSEIYGELSTALAKTGDALSVHDVWIAAQAVETGSVLITLDARFKGISGLRLWDHLK
jgi:tRNA(fMet)-specific endonuclease VapC